MTVKKVEMEIKVDLDCCKCSQKIKKVLCSIPQVKNQVYDEKSNKVTITVVCCSPEKIKQKICCKGGKCVISIETKPDPPQPPPPPPPPLNVNVNVDVAATLIIHGRPVCYCCGNVTCVRRVDYFCEEYSSGCIIM